MALIDLGRTTSLGMSIAATQCESTGLTGSGSPVDDDLEVPVVGVRDEVGLRLQPRGLVRAAPCAQQGGGVGAQIPSQDNTSYCNVS